MDTIATTNDDAVSHAHSLTLWHARAHAASATSSANGTANPEVCTSAGAWSHPKADPEAAPATGHSWYPNAGTRRTGPEHDMLPYHVNGTPLEDQADYVDDDDQVYQYEQMDLEEQYYDPQSIAEAGYLDDDPPGPELPAADADQAPTDFLRGWR
ncbi:hypothetical protein HDU88_001118 [Geranomyces variabilis]|nr:hypothetical protein HDU88_001118 [Geranomyces variabilis]